MSLPVPPSARDGITPPDVETEELEEQEALEAVAAIEEVAPSAGITTAAQRRQRPLPKLADPAAPLLVVEDLKTYFSTGSGPVRAVDGVSFKVEHGEALGIAGESGCGKTTTALSLVRILPANAKIISGSISLMGIDLVPKSDNALRRYRWREISIVFQGAMNALNPVRRIRDQIAEPIEERLGETPKAARKRAGDLLELVGIPRKRGDAYPHQLSGGMRQRAMIAMALACDPAIVIGDEPTTALDVMVQAQILELLEDLRQKLGLSLILITHDLSVIAETCDPGHGHVRRPDRGGRAGRRGLPPAAPSLHAEVDGRLPEYPLPTAAPSTSSPASHPICVNRHRAAGSHRAARS
jgi:ABC-type oligopeptide transport system ATPase subunit